MILETLFRSFSTKTENGKKKKPPPSENPLPDLSDVKEKIHIYRKQFVAGTRGPELHSFGSLNQLEIETIIEAFAVGNATFPRNPTSSVTKVYRTNLIHTSGKPLFMLVIGNYGVQISLENMGAVFED